MTARLLLHLGLAKEDRTCAFGVKLTKLCSEAQNAKYEVQYENSVLLRLVCDAAWGTRWRKPGPPDFFNFAMKVLLSMGLVWWWHDKWLPTTLFDRLAWISTAKDSPNSRIAKRFIGLRILRSNVIQNSAQIA